MSTTFDVLYLGTGPALDPTEGNESAENAAALVGTTVGSSGTPLYDNVESFSPGSTGYSGGARNWAYDTDNFSSNDTFRINGGPDHTMDTVVIYNATITYVDGTTAGVQAIVFQDTAGNLYLAPSSSYGAYDAALEAKPIQSLTFDSVSSSNNVLTADRYTAQYASVVDGTAGDDTMGVGYTDAEGDQITSGDDYIFGDAGNDSITGGGGNDEIAGGEGDDTFYFDDGWGNDIVYGDDWDGTGTGTDTLDFSAVSAPLTVTFTAPEDGTVSDGTNTVTFDNIEAIITGSGGDTIDASADNSGLYLDGGAGNDDITAGSGDDTIVGGTGNDTLTGGLGNDTFIYNVGDGSDIITDFNSGNTGTLADGDSTNNDFIDLSGFYDDIWELYADQADDGILNQSNDGVGDVDYSDNLQFGTGSLTFSGASANSAFFTTENTGVTCFTEGTGILTPEGERPVETLRPGDMVITADHGAQPVLWIGASHLDRAALLARPKLRPVLIRAGALGADRPLLVSPQHCVMRRDNDGKERFLRARHLAETPLARVAQGRREVTYIHLLCARHEVLFANGVASESFYPGPQALIMLAPELRDSLFAVLPALRHAPVASVLGSRARPVVPRREVFALFRKNAAGLPSPQPAFSPGPEMPASPA
ncbi:Hint domain-containing protein [Celeribacter neptunius]|uniref:Hemolysin-type calcium-binding repeat-containing protein n=1 Tax=Celeribacter neptunius TaxID=588602 RepID=A0A1I3LZB3_9RHOB|nr:Hint domain-containing protein [Celeribacter neptunius]SFI90109.1 Hemolysin-type calcium-binding repeat-containing protein [Celeribacter neptunius]